MLHKSLLFNSLIIGISCCCQFANADIVTPAGLNPGDQFRIVFVTQGIRSGNSTDINDYDAFVTAQANLPGIGLGTYAGTSINWHAIGSTTTVNANDPSRLSVSSTIPMYLPSGTLVATGGADLWDGSISAPINQFNATGDTKTSGVWTGSTQGGLTWPTQELGSASGKSIYGKTTENSNQWIFRGHNGLNGGEWAFYGYSSVLTAQSVPEPTSFIMFGSLGLLFVRTRRKA